MWRESSVWIPPGWTAVARIPLRLMAAVELDSEQDVGGLRATVSRPRIIGHALEIRIVEIDVGIAMAGRRQIDQPRARLHQRSDAVDQHEMAEVVGPELGLEPVGGLAEWRRHDAGVGDDKIERPAVGEERVGAGAHARERGEIELHDLKFAAVRGGGPDARGRRLGLVEVARRADHLGAVSDERARRLHAEARLTRLSPARACRSGSRCRAPRRWWMSRQRFSLRGSGGVQA